MLEEGVHSFLRRGLQGVESNSSSKDDNDSFLMLVTIIVGLIVLFYAICTFQCMRAWLCRRCCGRNRDGHTAETVLVHEGTVFNLSGDQRRAVLEAIFSETSKAITDKDVAEAKKRKKQQKKQETVPLDVEIPSAPTEGTEASMETDSRRASDHAADFDNSDSEDDIEQACSLGDKDLDDDSDEEIARMPDHSEDEVGSVRSVPSVEQGIPCVDDVVRSPAENPDIFEYEQNIDTIYATPKANEICEPTEVDSKPPAIPELTPVGTPLYLCDVEKAGDEEEGILDLSDKLLSLPNLSAPVRAANLTIPEDKSFEETKEEIEPNTEKTPDLPPQVMPVYSEESIGGTKDEIGTCAIPLPIPLLRRESFSTVASEYTFDDDSTGDNICPVCLSGYKKGDILVVSKYCTHAFHKECILEWLEKHDECPVCRTAMVTDSEMSRAATSLIGKTRMYRAVRSYQSSNQQHHSPPPSPHDRSQSSSLSQTMRRVYSTPYR